MSGKEASERIQLDRNVAEQGFVQINAILEKVKDDATKASEVATKHGKVRDLARDAHSAGHAAELDAEERMENAMYAIREAEDELSKVDNSGCDLVPYTAAVDCARSAAKVAAIIYEAAKEANVALDAGYDSARNSASLAEFVAERAVHTASIYEHAAGEIGDTIREILRRGSDAGSVGAIKVISVENIIARFHKIAFEQLHRI